MARRCAPRSRAEPNDSRGGAGLTEMKRLGVAALQLMLTFSNQVHLAKICAEQLEMFP